MIKRVFIFQLVLVLISGCSKEEPVVDTESPVITCPEDINVIIEASQTGAVVNYETPFGRDNVGANTDQIEGLISGEEFPVGTTTNTFRARDLAGNETFCSFNIVVTQNITANNGEQPYFTDGDPLPSTKKWVKVTTQTDEFNDNEVDNTKWRLISSGNWIGRPPGLFLSENVSESEGNLRIKATKLDNDQTINGDVFTHGGGYVEGLHAANVGNYLECRMKANQTFMSSTFWLNNKRNEGSGCDVRVTELDIQECVGTLTGTSSLALRGWDKIMHSNTHSRSTSCTQTVEGSSAKWNGIGENVAENYHVYGAWWKSEREIICYLDGKEIHTLVPKADFNLNSYLRLVVETYDWNPVPSDGGMNFTELERTTLYDWVRVWKLEDK